MKSFILSGVVCTRKSLNNTPAAGVVVGTSSVPSFSFFFACCEGRGFVGLVSLVRVVPLEVFFLAFLVGGVGDFGVSV